MKAFCTIAVLLALLILTVGCGAKHSGIGGAAGEATAATVAANDRFSQLLIHANAQDDDEARRGFMARPTGRITNAKGEVLVDFDAFALIE